VVIATTLRRRVPVRDVLFITQTVIVSLLNSGNITSVTAVSNFLWVVIVSYVGTCTISKVTAHRIMTIVTMQVAIDYLKSACVLFATYGTMKIAFVISPVAAASAEKFTMRQRRVHVHCACVSTLAVNAQLR
jgi:hypothetical protein